MTTATETDQLIVDKLRKRYAGCSEKEVRDDLKAKYTETWNDAELAQQFDVREFDGPVVQVTRKSDGLAGTVGYIDSPRVYFAFIEDSNE